MWISVIRGLSYRTESALQFEEIIPAEIGKKMRRRKLIGGKPGLRYTCLATGKIKSNGCELWLITTLDVNST